MHTAVPDMKPGVNGDNARPRILCVDDEPSILAAIKRQLRRDYEVVTADSGADALEILKATSFEVILSDERMPGMRGNELLRLSRDVAPDAVRILLTGYADAEALASAVNSAGIFRFLQKPWSERDLSTAVEAAVEFQRLTTENKRLHRLTEEQNFRFAEYNRQLAKKVSRKTGELNAVVQSLQKTLEAAIGALVRAASWKDPGFESHSRRVSLLAVALANRLGIEDDELTAIRWGASLHDIGKLLTGDCKALDPALQSEHAASGAELIESIPGHERTALFIRHHHERWDGNGHPDRLAGADIPIGSRIIAVADAFDHAMIPEHGEEPTGKLQALDDVQRQALRKLDPAVLEALAEEIGDESWTPDYDGMTVGLGELEPGMVLSMPLRTAEGKLVAADGHVLDASDIERIRRIAKVAPMPPHATLRQPIKLRRESGTETTSGASR